MKNKLFLAAGILMLMPLTTHAQGFIKRAFNVLITSEPAQVESSHKLNKNPETRVKEGQLDVYEFTIPASHHDLVEDVERAFEQDKEKAYSMKTASATSKKSYDYTSLAVGGDDSGYPLGDIKGSRYIYALFLDPEDMTKTHRYAYAMEWRKDEKEIVGKLIVTYATTQQYRESGKKGRIFRINGNDVKLSANGFSFGDDDLFSGFFSMGEGLSAFGSDSTFVSSSIGSESWLSQFNTFKNLFLKNPNSTASNYYASHIYKMCKKADALDDMEKKMVIKELEKVMKATNDEFLQEMFQASIERLKK